MGKQINGCTNKGDGLPCQYPRCACMYDTRPNMPPAQADLIRAAIARGAKASFGDNGELIIEEPAAAHYGGSGPIC